LLNLSQIKDDAVSQREKQPLSAAELRQRLTGLQGQRYWRTLEELAQSDEFQRVVERDFPSVASLLNNGLSRRDFLRIMSASLALAGLGACAERPTEQIVPYVQAPEERLTGKSLDYATAFTLAGYATGILVKSYEGRPIKIEGNPEHPASLGGTNPFIQASILTLYDPERSQVVRQSTGISTWDDFVRTARARLDLLRPSGGAGLRLLTGAVTSPTLSEQIGVFLKQFPQAKWHAYDPISRDNTREGMRLAFGQDGECLYRFDRAEVILALDCDFLFSEPGSLRYARDFSRRRRVRGEKAEMSRLYVAEPTPSITGSMADHRLAITAGRIVELAQAVAWRLGSKQIGGQDAQDLAPYRAWIETVAADLQEHRGSSLVIAGEFQPPQVHLLAHSMNQLLGNGGATVVYTEPLEGQGVNRAASVQELAREMAQGAVETLFIAGTNPVYSAPADLRFREALSKVRFRAHFSEYEDETSALCQWHVPQAHFLETWSDARSFDGVATIMQPLIAPLYGGRSAHELIAALTGSAEESSYDIVRAFWRRRAGKRDFDAWWERALHDGFVPDTGASIRSTAVRTQTAAPSEQASVTARPDEGLELTFRPDPTIWDGRFANNAWLQELPKPLSKLTWDNAALISPRTAQRLNLSSGNLVELRLGDSSITAPVWIHPGQADQSVTVHLGYGRSRAGKVGSAIGFNAYPLRTSQQPWFAGGLQIKQTGRRHELVTTQGHHTMEGRPLVRSGTLEQYRENPEFVHEMGHEPPPGMSLYPEHRFDVSAWAMVIDTTVCIGCNACVVACQAENNIPVVGKDQVARGREMHWLRVDRYYGGPPENPEVLFQPVPCMHCENAPCEPVCPVAATAHSTEGLNDMVYNRCVGTRYCSNNCPYKVRRFNFFQYADFTTEVRKLGYNPDVTVRSRGVMEKCTYCVQRINHARIEAKKDDRRIADGDVITACAQACPTEAIIFGDMTDPNAAVAKLKKEPLNYAMLAELNTRPRTTYLARLKNPNANLGAQKK
jgi:MoCo/4Fe-4S cofactor protein with predicted Tat translocation signal